MCVCVRAFVRASFNFKVFNYLWIRNLVKRFLCKLATYTTLAGLKMVEIILKDRNTQIIRMYDGFSKKIIIFWVYLIRVDREQPAH